MEMLAHPATLLFVTVTVYWITNIIRARTGSFLFNPVVLSSTVMILYLLAFKIDYATYHEAAQMIDFWLKPAVVSLAVPLYINWKKIRSQWLPIIISQTAGSVTGIVTGVYIAKWMGAEREVVLSLAAKSVTNPIAIEITRTIGGIPAITAATVILAGMMGQMIGYRLLRASTIRTPTSQGMSIGAASHAMGIAASLERSRKFAAYASLGLIFNGVLTAALVPILIPLMGV
ncbi:murein hydrolase transporter LrgB [Neisseria arctica]|uniref:Murein hydrolase transporter LrgB n=1 Tax=Neisseria arctica TaxID=1470200 RepID=A0A0J0YUY3_9NEIS|nr:LrgB family protein [Neisseria arctica]KLT73896.1 murein hydrolase transporter LrgB [Neisseria arctica]UOO86908.1 LrgB family protein [Neisseria arctica]